MLLLTNRRRNDGVPDIYTYPSVCTIIILCTPHGGAGDEIFMDLREGWARYQTFRDLVFIIYAYK